jgi:hypothetical protein
MIPEERLAQIDGYDTWHLKMLLKDNEHNLQTLRFCSDAAWMKPHQGERIGERVVWIDEARQIIARVRAELERRSTQ